MKKILLFAILLIIPAPLWADDATSTPATTTPVMATITIRNGNITAFTGTVELATSTAPAVDIAPTNSSTTVAVPADSFLATLVALDATTADFNITDLAYFSSFNSFIINCIAVPAASTTNCFNWTYAVGGTFPQIGIDDTILQDGDVAYLFFGPPRQTVISTTTASVGEPFTATAQRYDLESGSYVGATGLILGVGTPNPDFSFTEFATSTSDENGQAIFTLNATGTFAVGIQEDFYFPSASILITATTSVSTSSEQAAPIDNPPPTGGGGGGVVHFQLNVPSALAYLASKQNADGSFSSPLYTDWAAIAFAASDAGTAKTNLRNYLLISSPTLSSATDYERHAMALMALGIDPYSGTATNYIDPIVNAFDGTQIGYSTLATDDIFALFPLLHAGYSTSDDIIKKTVAYIISAQTPGGGWDDSVDVTSAAVQALSQVTSLPGVTTSLAHAETYLHARQQANGGFGNGQSNSFSSSWALQAIAALGQPMSSWMPGGQSPNDYLASLQQPDGGIEPATSDESTRLWATEYAVVGSLGKTWTSLLQSFEKPANATTGSGGGTVLGVSTSTATTSASSTATTTLHVATTTLPIATLIQDIISTSTPVIETIEKPVAPPKPRPKAKAPVPKISLATLTLPIATTSTYIAQTAGAATPPGNFFTKIWRAVTSFFSSLF